MEAPEPEQATSFSNPDQTNLDDFYEKAQKRVSIYKPIYFAYGQPSTKVQISFRSVLSDTIPINFAYTQIMFWELTENSKPFQDTTYNPEFFYRLNPSGDKWTSLDIGLWEHNSNGKGSEDSRSYNQSYIRGVYATQGNSWVSFVAVKLKLMYAFDDTNRDITRYVGPLDIDLRFAKFLDGALDHSELILSLSPGGKYATDLSKGGYQVAVNFHVKGWHFNPAFYLQYYYGYAETLLNYNERVNSFRFGVMF